MHGGCGLWGLFARAFFSVEEGIFYVEPKLGFRFFGWQLLGAICIVLWASLTAYAMFWVLKKLGQLRVKPEYEERGMDVSFYGGRKSWTAWRERFSPSLT